MVSIKTAYYGSKLSVIRLLFTCLFSMIITEDISAQIDPVSYRPPVSSMRVPESLTFCGVRVPLERLDIKERLEREFYYMLDKEGQLVLYLKRAARCNPIVEPILKEAGLPDDLKYVPVAESGLLFREVSPAGAAGYWQFLKNTASHYGLRVDRTVDERRDLARSTKAAALYLKKLHETFGSWETALAAYNWGWKNVSQAVKSQGTNNYYDLYLPDESDRFVFRIILFKIILENPRAYSIYLPESELYQPQKTRDVEIRSKKALPISALAESARVSPRTFRFLNPWMLKNILHSGNYSFAVPELQADGYQQRVARLTGKNLMEFGIEREKTVHQVKSGENLSLIALKYRVSIIELEKWNNISRKRVIRPGQWLVVGGYN